MNILLLHAGGQTAYDSEAVKAYGSLENLIASDELAGIPNREKSLGQLWEAAHMPVPDWEELAAPESESASEGEKAANLPPVNLAE